MPVESKMAVGFWQMQTFEMAVRKGGFVEGFRAPVGVRKSDMYDPREAGVALWGFQVGALGDMAPELMGHTTWAPDGRHVFPIGQAKRPVLAWSGAARMGSVPRQRMRHSFLPRCFGRMDVRQVTPGHDTVFRPAATGSAVRAVGASVRRSR